MAKKDTPKTELQQAEERLGRLMLEGLGRAVLAWSLAEQTSEATLGIIGSAHGMPFEEASILGTTVDLRDRGALITALGYKLAGKEPWFKDMVDLVNSLSNDLRNQRNRLLHDAWSDEGGRLLRRSGSVKLTKPQSHKLDLLVPDFQPVSPEDLNKFIEACLKVARGLNEINKKLIDTLEPKPAQGFLSRLFRL